MCGIAGIVRAGALIEDRDVAAAERVRDRMIHRGPDDAGLWRGVNAVLAHRRLAVIDPTPAGRQPMASADGSVVVTYNGELYNDADVRAQLRADGVVFRTACDAETVVEAIARWGQEAPDRFRGMFALAWWDVARQRLTLARDPMGIKPLHFVAIGARALVFASEIPALLEHPACPREPDWTTVYAYLRTGCTTWDDRTMFEGVRTLRPGEVITIDASGDGLANRRRRLGGAPSVRAAGGAGGVERAGPVDLGEAIADSVRLHLRSDVPSCALLSGGLDSTLIAAHARRESGGLRTYCAGAKTDEPSDDFPFARDAAAWLGTDHREVVISRGSFARRVRGLIEHQLAPLSTPNEVAIEAVSRRIRADGRVVALSGEGADELFGGYGALLDAASRWIAMTAADADGGAFELGSGAWCTRAEALELLAPVAGEIEPDALESWYRCLYRDSCRGPSARGLEGADAERLRGHVAVRRRVNLERLLRRLDSCTMAASVEGRTPLADARIASIAGALPVGALYRPAGSAGSAGDGEPRTKLALRAAAAGAVPEAIRVRAKASFPLPFRSWMSALTTALDGAWVRGVLHPEVGRVLVGGGDGSWRRLWPALNLGIWGEAVFERPAAVVRRPRPLHSGN